MSDPLEALRKISESEKQESRGEGDAAARAAEKERERERRKAAAKAASAAKAPGVLQSMRFFGVMLVGLMILSGLAAIALEGDWWSWTFVGEVAGAWAVLLGLLVLDGVTWKRRLPFKLVGFEAIGGKDGSGSDRVPWIAFDLSIQFVATDGPRGGKPLVQTMEILARRINRAMQSDKEASFSGAKVWRVTEDGVLRGEATVVVYTTRLFEKWLRREVRLLHAAVPIASVQVKAKYTGSSYQTSSD